MVHSSQNNLSEEPHAFSVVDNPIRKGVVNLLVALSAVLVSMIVLELAVRVPLARAPSTPTSDRPRTYYLPAMANSLRGNVFTPELKSGPRICIIGDSFSFGPGLQFFDTFPHKLKQLLNLNGYQPAMDVINYGTPGASTEDEVQILEKAFVAQPDLIVLEITLNDPQSEPFRKLPIEFARQETYLGRWFSWSALYKLVTTRLFNQRTITRYIDYHQELFSKTESFDRFANSLTAIKSKADAKNIPLTVMVFPLFDFPLDKTYPFSNIHQKISGKLDELRIPHLDLFESYRGMNHERLQIQPGADSHPNEIAHRIAAEALYGWLIDEDVIPSTYQAQRTYNSRQAVFQRAVKTPPGDQLRDLE